MTLVTRHAALHDAAAVHRRLHRLLRASAALTRDHVRRGPVRPGRSTDTYFVVAHFHYIIFGAAVFPIFGGIYYWFPKVTGRMYHERLGQCELLAARSSGRTLTFFPMHIVGLLGMPRRVYTYPRRPRLGRPTTCSRRSAASSLAGGPAADRVNLVVSPRHGAPAGSDPWHGGDARVDDQLAAARTTTSRSSRRSRARTRTGTRTTASTIGRTSSAGELVLERGTTPVATSPVDAELAEVVEMPHGSPWPVAARGRALARLRDALDPAASRPRRPRRPRLLVLGLARRLAPMRACGAGATLPPAARPRPARPSPTVVGHARPDRERGDAVRALHRHATSTCASLGRVAAARHRRSRPSLAPVLLTVAARRSPACRLQLASPGGARRPAAAARGLVLAALVRPVRLPRLPAARPTRPARRRPASARDAYASIYYTLLGADHAHVRARHPASTSGCSRSSRRGLTPYRRGRRPRSPGTGTSSTSRRSLVTVHPALGPRCDQRPPRRPAVGSGCASGAVRLGRRARRRLRPHRRRVRRRRRAAGASATTRWQAVVHGASAVVCRARRGGARRSPCCGRRSNELRGGARRSARIRFLAIAGVARERPVPPDRPARAASRRSRT